MINNILKFGSIFSLVYLIFSCNAKKMHTEIDLNRKAYSRDVMRTIVLAIKSYYLEESKYPISLNDMVPVYCQPGKNGFNDGWGGSFYYDNITGEVRSAGRDGLFHTVDDFYIKQDGTNNF